MGLYNTSRAQLGGSQFAPRPQAQVQPSWTESRPQAMSTQMAPAPQMNPMTAPAFRGGLNGAMKQPSYQGAVPYYQPPQPQMGPPPVASVNDIQQQQARQNVGVQLNQNAGNSALAGYMFG